MIKRDKIRQLFNKSIYKSKSWSVVMEMFMDSLKIKPMLKV